MLKAKESKIKISWLPEKIIIEVGDWYLPLIRVTPATLTNYMTDADGEPLACEGIPTVYAQTRKGTIEFYPTNDYDRELFFSWPEQEEIDDE